MLVAAGTRVGRFNSSTGARLVALALAGSSGSGSKGGEGFPPARLELTSSRTLV